MGDMQRIAACLLVLCVASGVDLYTQKGKEARHFLIAADDLHLQFSSTPRIRELIRRTIRLSLRDTDLVALVSTGASAINVPATSELDVVDSAVKRVTGQGLSPRAVLSAPEQSDVASELRGRANGTFSTVANALDAIASSPHNAIAVLYFSDGYLSGVTPEPTELIQSALRANAAIHTIDLRGLMGGQTVTTVTQTEWDAYVRATQNSLRTLAIQTRGTPVFTVSELDALLSRLAKMGSDSR
jgi:hypothetical protein